jgi:hypothetical protein
MVGPQEMAKLGNFLKDALLPLMAGDVGLAGVGGLGRFDPLPIPFGQIIGKGAKGAKGIWRAIKGGDEAVEAVSAVVRAGDDLTPSLLRSQGFLGDARLAPTRHIGKGVTVSEIGLDTGGYLDRPFVVVRLPDGRLQPFYRSSGFMSEQPGEWFSFDGFGGMDREVFNPGLRRKGPYTQGVYGAGTPEHRYGPYREVSELLSRELEGAEPTVLFDMQKVSYNELNEALGTHITFEDYERAIREQIEAGATTANMPSPMRVETPDRFGPEHDIPLADTLAELDGVERFRAMRAGGRAEARTWFDNLSDKDQAAAIVEWEKSSKPLYTDPNHVFDPADDYDVRNAYTAARRAGAEYHPASDPEGLEGLPGAPTGRVGASGFAIDELPEGTAASLGKQKWTLDAHNSLSGSPEAVVFDEDTFEIVGYGPLGESFKGPAHIQSRLTDSDYMPDPIRVVMLRAKRSGPGWQEGDYISVQVGYLRETGAPKLGLSDEFGIGDADMPDDIAKEVWDQTWEGFDIGSAERIGGGVGLDPQRGTQPWGNIWTREQDPLSSPSWPQYRNMGVTEAHWIEDQAAQHWTFTQEFIDREYPIVQRYRELQGIDDALEGPPGGVARETGGK